MNIAQPFVYGGDADDQGAGDRPSVPVSVLSDRPHVRANLVEQVLEAGLQLRHADSLDRLREDDALVLGDVVIVDAPSPGAELIAALARLDGRAANCGTQLIVSTQVESIDTVFGAMDRAAVQFLVDPSPAEFALAIGVSLASLPKRSVHEFAHEDHVALVRLTEQVHSLARKLGGASTNDASERTVRSPSLAYMVRPASDTPRDDVARHPTGLPPASLLREIIRQRNLRARFFDAELFADPAWDMLLDLAAARAEKRDVCVSSLCIASGVPATTALRWIAQMTDSGLFERLPDPADRRRAIIRLSYDAEAALTRFFSGIGANTAII